MTLKSVSKRFSDGSSVLSNINLKLDPGEILVLSGPTGSGKTTLAKIIGGYETATTGEIFINSRPVTGEAMSRRNVSVIFNNQALYDAMTVRDNIRTSLRLIFTPVGEIDSRTESICTKLDMNDIIDTPVSSLSPVRRREVVLARAAAREPAIMVIDHDESIKDKDELSAYCTALEKVCVNLGISLLFATNDRRFMYLLSGRVALLREGIVQQSGPIDFVEANPANLFVAKYCASPEMHTFTATLRRGMGGFYLECNHCDLSLNPGAEGDRLAGYINREITVGVSPRAVVPSPDADLNVGGVLAMTIDAVNARPAGKSVTLSAGDILAEAPFKEGYEEGGQLTVTLDRNYIFGFDKETEKCIF